MFSLDGTASECGFSPMPPPPPPMAHSCLDSLLHPLDKIGFNKGSALFLFFLFVLCVFVELSH